MKISRGERNPSWDKEVAFGPDPPSEEGDQEFRVGVDRSSIETEMDEKAIRDRLVDHGKALFNEPRSHIPVTGVAEADALLNDLDGHPHAFVLACVMDRQMKAEKAWLIPYHIAAKLGGFDGNPQQILGDGHQSPNVTTDAARPVR